MTVPSLIIWLIGYSYSTTLGNYTAIMIFISGVIFSLYVYDDTDPMNKKKSSIVLLVIIGVFVLLFSFSSIFSQRTSEIFSKTSYQNYKAIHSRDFDLVLSGPQRVTIKKTKILGLIEKTIFNETLPSPDTISNCILHLNDGNKKLSFNYCKNILTGEK
jgi:multisubunit Na+/H+ antiporter MnhB subunit